MLLIPTVAQAEAGFYMDVEPVTICDANDQDKLREALTKALAMENPVIPTPEVTDDPGSVILDKLGLRKWLPFEAEAMMYTVHIADNKIECYSTGRAVRGSWQRNQSKHMTFDPPAGMQSLIESIMIDMKTERAAELAEQAGKPSGGLTLLLPPPEN